METRKKNKRRISFSSSESSEAPTPKTTKITMRHVQPESPEDVSDASSVLSDALSAPEFPEDGEEEEDLAEEEEEDASDEDAEAIIESIMQPQVDKSRKTARQKAKETGAADHLEFLPIDKNAKVKPVLTAEELALRKSENARKRKNQTEKKLDEEKQETINRLLNKQAGKRKGAVKQLTVADASLEEAEEAAIEVRKTRPIPLGMTRYVNNKAGSLVSIPSELIGHVTLQSLLGDKASQFIAKSSQKVLHYLEYQEPAMVMVLYKRAQQLHDWFYQDYSLRVANKPDKSMMTDISNVLDKTGTRRIVDFLAASTNAHFRENLLIYVTIVLFFFMLAATHLTYHPKQNRRIRFRQRGTERIRIKYD